MVADDLLMPNAAGRRGDGDEERRHYEDECGERGRGGDELEDACAQQAAGGGVCESFAVGVPADEAEAAVRDARLRVVAVFGDVVVEKLVRLLVARRDVARRRLDGVHEVVVYERVGRFVLAALLGGDEARDLELTQRRAY